MVRAIDLQQSILQTSPTEKIQQIQQQHSDMQQRYQQLKLSEEDRLAREKVKEFEQTDKTKIRAKGEQKDKRQGSNRQPQDKEKQSIEDWDEDIEEGGHINITV